MYLLIWSDPKSLAFLQMLNIICKVCHQCPGLGNSCTDSLEIKFDLLLEKIPYIFKYSSIINHNRLKFITLVIIWATLEKSEFSISSGSSWMTCFDFKLMALIAKGLN